MSDSVQPQRRQPTRLPRPWDSPGKNTGVGCHFLLQCMKVKSETEVAQSCLTLSDPMDCSLPGSSIHGIFQAGVLEWGAIAFSGKIVQYLTSHRNTIVESLISLGFSSVTQSYLTLYNPMNCSMPGLPIHPQLLEFIRTHVHWVSDAIRPSHPLSSPFPPTFNLSQHQGLFKWGSSSHQVAKVLEFQLQHQSFQWIFRTDFL